MRRNGLITMHMRRLEIPFLAFTLVEAINDQTEEDRWMMVDRRVKSSSISLPHWEENRNDVTFHSRHTMMPLRSSNHVTSI